MLGKLNNININTDYTTCGTVPLFSNIFFLIQYVVYLYKYIAHYLYLGYRYINITFHIQMNITKVNIYNSYII